MSYSRPQRHRSDGNQADLIKAFVKLGGFWVPYANKPFDGWARHARFGYMPVEIKLESREGHANEYTPRQKKVLAIMKIAGAPWLVWRNENDVIACVSPRKGLPNDFEVIHL